LAPDENPVSERWRDLLLAEHLALSVLGIDTEVFDFGIQRFLEVPRFDRVGQFGRLGVFSCARWKRNSWEMLRQPGRRWSVVLSLTVMSMPMPSPVLRCCGHSAP
jgi:hypothetical protein